MGESRVPRIQGRRARSVKTGPVIRTGFSLRANRVTALTEGGGAALVDCPRVAFSWRLFMAASLPTFGDLLAARRRLGQLACLTPLIEHPALNAVAGGRVLLKAENLQRVGAFKFRGAYNKIAQLDKAAYPGGV